MTQEYIGLCCDMQTGLYDMLYTHAQTHNSNANVLSCSAKHIASHDQSDSNLYTKKKFELLSS